MPVMEGKCVLFKAFGGVDAFPLCVKTQERRRVRRDRLQHLRQLRRHQPRGYLRAALLRDRAQAEGKVRHPHLPRRSARHRRHHPRRPDERAEGRRQEEGGRQGRHLRRRRCCHLHCEAAAVRWLQEHHHVRPQGRDLCRPRRPELDQGRNGPGHESGKEGRPAVRACSRAPTCSSAFPLLAWSRRKWSRP